MTVPFGTVMVCAVPGVIAVPLMLLMLKVSPSTSVSLPNKFNTVGVSSTIGNGVATVPSSTATGGSLTGVTFKLTLPVSVAPLGSCTT